MGKNKLINLSALKRYWQKTEAWILINLQALFDNDEELDAKITGLQDKVREISNIILPQTSEDITEDEYTEEEVLAIITPETEDSEDSETFGD